MVAKIVQANRVVLLTENRPRHRQIRGGSHSYVGAFKSPVFQ